MVLWKEKYRCGVEIIDEQHKELFQRVTDFVETVRSPKPWAEKLDKINATLEFLKDYVISHFRDEEAFSKEIGYPAFEAHKRLHDGMVQYVAQIVAQYEEQGYKEQLMQQLSGRLLAWLINHVASDDQKIAAYARERGVV